MAGIYIHIPFCKQACSYCDFHFSTSLKNKKTLVDCICREVEMRKEYLQSAAVKSIYFGGGTPSLLQSDEIKKILDAIYQMHVVEADVELSFEVNPDDIDSKKLKELSNLGVNRLSIGIQSFHKEDLQLMNRAHNVEKAHSSIQESLDAGFENISIDLIYGSPTTSNQMWEDNLMHFFNYNLPHLSSYCLSIEDKTALQHQIKTGKVPKPSDEKASEQFEMLQKMIAENHYEQYEVSNFCRDGLYSKHNTSYWNNTNYLGLGPSAHSFNGFSRQHNIANNSRYIKSISKGETLVELELLSPRDRLNEYVMTNLRTKWGIDLAYIKKTFPTSLTNEFFKILRGDIFGEMCVVEADVLKIQPSKFLYTDKLIRELFLLE